MTELMQPAVDSSQEEITKEYHRVKQMLEKKMTGHHEETKYETLSDAITGFVSFGSKKERELKLQYDKVEFEMGELKKKKEDLEQKESMNQSMISKLSKDNQLVKTNLREVYEELLNLVYPDQNDSEKTFEQIMDQLAETLHQHSTAIKQHQDMAKEVTLLKQETQSYKSELVYLKHENESIKKEVNQQI